AGYCCTAVDLSPQMVAATRSRLGRLGLLDRATVLRARGQSLPFPDASFDSVVSTFPTEYIADPAALREIRRVPRPGGRLIVVLSAGLLPTRLLLVPLVWLQDAVYGTRSGAGAASCAASIAALGPLPLSAGDFTPRAECVRGPFWVAYLIVGEK